jgi:hypothetical protein
MRAITTVAIAAAIGLLAGCAGSPSATDGTTDVVVAPGGASDQPVISGFSTADTALVEELVNKLPDPELITAVEKVPAPPPSANEDGSIPSAPQGGRYVRITLGGDSADPLSRTQARWQAVILLGALYKELPADPAAPFLGGKAVFAQPPPAGIGSQDIDFRFAPNAKILFTNPAGKPSSLMGPLDGQARIAEEAESHGLTVDSEQTYGLLGVIPVVELTVADPKAYVSRVGPGSDVLAANALDYEGALVIVRDPQGTLVKVNGYATGLQMGLAWVNPQFEQLATGTTTPQETPG